MRIVNRIDKLFFHQFSNAKPFPDIIYCAQFVCNVSFSQEDMNDS